MNMSESNAKRIRMCVRSQLTQAAAPDDTPGTAGRSTCAARLTPFQI